MDGHHHASLVGGDSLKRLGRRYGHVADSDHEDDTASFNIYSKHWYCFGCNRGGRIYDFAGYLWDLPLRGEGFKQIQRQLAERFP